jgi:hypothetical protein
MQVCNWTEEKNKIRTGKVLLETEKRGKTEGASTDSERSRILFA